MMAIRCRAPFAYQRSEYHGRPDLVLFGKGVKTNGIAIDCGLRTQVAMQIEPKMWV